MRPINLIFIAISVMGAIVGIDAIVVDGWQSGIVLTMVSTILPATALNRGAA